MPVQLPPGVVPSSPPPAAVQNNGGWQTPAPQPGGGVELNSGESILSPRPATQPGQLPQWGQQYNPPQYQQQPAQQTAPAYQQPAFQYPQVAQPVYQPPPGYQPPVTFQQPPPAPAFVAQNGQIIAQQVAATQQPPQPNIQQFTLPPDPAYAQPRQPFQFNDGLVLGGHTGGGNTAGGLGGPPAQPAQVVHGTPSGVSVQGQPSAAYTQPSTALRDALVASGVQVAHYPSDEAVLADFGQTAEQLNHLRQMARLGYQYLEAQRQPASQQPPQTPQQAAQPPAPQQPQKSTRPEWKSEWDGMVRRDPATGRFVAVDASAVNPLIVERANEVEAWRRERAVRMVNDPLGLLKEEGLDQLLAEQIKSVKDEVRQELVREEQTRAGQQRVQEFLTANQAAFYVLDQTGRQLTNNLTGQPLLTQLGQHAFSLGNQYAQQFEQQYGVSPDPATVIDYVQLRLRAEGYQGPQQMQQQVPLAGPGTLPPNITAPNVGARPSADQLKEQIIANAMASRQQQIALAAHAPNTGGTIAAAAQVATQPQNTRLSFRDMLVQGAIEKGRLPANFQSF